MLTISLMMFDAQFLQSLLGRLSLDFIIWGGTTLSTLL